MGSKINIAIDGHSGTGKSSTAKAVASKLGYTYIDSGAMYRAVTLHFLNTGVDLRNIEMVERSLSELTIDFRFNKKSKRFETYLNNKNVEDDIRSMLVSEHVSQVSTIRLVRQQLVQLQRKLGSKKGVVMDGRDIGTVVFPDAELKVFMTADISTRAHRRLSELQRDGVNVTLKEIEENILHRDKIDTTREISPLKKAEDAVEIDTSDITFDQQVQMIHDLAIKTTDR